jgi:hypothetical protein
MLTWQWVELPRKTRTPLTGSELFTFGKPQKAGRSDTRIICVRAGDRGHGLASLVYESRPRRGDRRGDPGPARPRSSTGPMTGLTLTWGGRKLGFKTRGTPPAFSLAAGMTCRPAPIGPRLRGQRTSQCDPKRSPAVTLPEQERANVFHTKIVLVPTTSMRNGWRQDFEVVG